MSGSLLSFFENKFSFEEIEFIAENELISIVPNFRMDKLHLISGSIGPFFPQIPIQVPIWLAMALKKRKKCQIQVPEWMNVEKLSQLIKEERESEFEYQSLPFHYIEISELVFESDLQGMDIPDRYLVRTLIKDLRDIRFNKLEVGFKRMTQKTHGIRLSNLSAMELNLMRPFLVEALKQFFKHGVN